ncbi:MAG: caspase family protein [Verrucomicrobia bacterium]|nr:caspase family protein [Verrucomicrobiota bacterium]
MKISTYIATFIAAATLNAQAGKVICIGINEYADRTNLEHAENDALVVANTFKAHGHEVVILTGAAATQAAIAAAIATHPDIVYFAGHGERGRLIAVDGDIEISTFADSKATFLLDACFVGSGLKATGNVKVLAAARHRAYEADGHGIFTKHLINWLNQSGEFIADEVSSYVAKKIRFETGGSQKSVLGYI